MVSGSTEGGKQKEPSRKTALFCKGPLDFVWQLCFMVKYGRSHQKASYPDRNLKNPLKHTMATAAHTGDMPRVYI